MWVELLARLCACIVQVFASRATGRRGTTSISPSTTRCSSTGDNAASVALWPVTPRYLNDRRCAPSCVTVQPPPAAAASVRPSRRPSRHQNVVDPVNSRAVDITKYCRTRRCHRGLQLIVVATATVVISAHCASVARAYHLLASQDIVTALLHWHAHPAIINTPHRRLNTLLVTDNKPLLHVIY